MKKRMILMVVASLLLLTTACKNETVNDKEVLLDTISAQRPEANIGIDTSNIQVPADGKYPVMTFGHEEHDFGTIKQGVKVVYDFKFENTGKSDLLITAAKGSCGCTVPEYPKTPIKAGESGNIKVSFDSKGKQGETTKTVTIMCNTKEGNKILKIKANIEVPAKD